MEELLGSCGQFEFSSLGVKKELKVRFSHAVIALHGSKNGNIGRELERALIAHIQIMETETELLKTVRS